ncbi:MAG: type II toxin-antitoxin system RelE/ParE family toxin [Salinivirgaceae bacterium]
MKIIWSDFASATLKDIYVYYKEKSGVSVAKRIKSNIFMATKHLIKNPNSGQIELSLEKLNEGYRYLVESNYKIIYKQVAEGILITDVFDCRQDPIKMNDENRSLR